MDTLKVPQVVFIYNRYKTASATKKAAVEIRITYRCKQKYISTGIMLYPNQWKNGKIVNCQDIVYISKALDKLISDVRNVIFDMINSGSIDINTIPQRLQKLRESEQTFLDFCEKRAHIRQYGKSDDNKGRYSRFLRRFKEWGKIVSFDDVSEENVIAYDKYLKSKGLKDSSKWDGYHRFLNSFILDAIDAGLIKKNPYKWIHIDKGSDTEALNRHLTPMEFLKIRNTKMPTESLERIKDLFVFQTYTCLSYTDLKNFSTDHIKTIKKVKVYISQRLKTQREFTIPLLSPALDILAKYNNRLPIISNVKYNYYLKVVAQNAGIDKPVSSHWARHTGATLLLNEGVPIQIVSKICGHSSIRITEQVYAKLLDETVVNAVQEARSKLI
jgi:site-specific recombinase XerD